MNFLIKINLTLSLECREQNWCPHAKASLFVIVQSFKTIVIELSIFNLDSSCMCECTHTHTHTEHFSNSGSLLS